LNLLFYSFLIYFFYHEFLCYLFFNHDPLIYLLVEKVVAPLQNIIFTTSKYCFSYWVHH